MKKKTGWLVLTVIAVVAGTLLAFVNQVTAGPISQQNMERAQGALAELFPEADAFEEVTLASGDELQSAYTAMKSGQAVGYAVTVSSQGYGGPIEVITGLEPGFALRGIRVGGSDFKETEGLGSRVKEAAFTDQFAGKTPPLALGRDIDGVSGATVSSSAVVEGVNEAAKWTEGHFGGGGSNAAASAAPQPAAEENLRTANASVIGYAGPVLVRLSLTEQNTIASLRIGEERMQETQGLGARVAEEQFAQQFIGLTPPVQEGDIELIAGATISSRAALEAVNQAAAFLMEAAE